MKLETNPWANLEHPPNRHKQHALVTYLPKKKKCTYLPQKKKKCTVNLNAPFPLIYFPKENLTIPELADFKTYKYICHHFQKIEQHLKSNS